MSSHPSQVYVEHSTCPASVESTVTQNNRVSARDGRSPPLSVTAMLRLLRAPTPSRQPTHARCFHASLARLHLVGPPDPVSHLRPVIYDDAPPPPPPHVRHPYSLREFTGDTREYQWKMLRQEIDAFNHNFWKEVRTRPRVFIRRPTLLTPTSQSNTRFYAAKEAVLQSLPEGTTPEQRESVLTDFYYSWVVQERTRLDKYGEEWRRRNWDAILLGARVHYEKFLSRIMHPFS